MKKILLFTIVVMAISANTALAETKMKNQTDITSKADVFGLKLGMKVDEAIHILNKRINSDPKFNALITRYWASDAEGKEEAFEMQLYQCAHAISKCEGDVETKVGFVRFMPKELGGQLVNVHSSEDAISLRLQKTEILNMMGEKPQSFSIPQENGYSVRSFSLWGGIAPLPHVQSELSSHAFGGKYVFVSEGPLYCDKTKEYGGCGNFLNLEIEDSVQHGILLKEMRKRGMLK